MGQSELGYLNRQRGERLFETAACCESDGILARQRGESSVDNPFLPRDGIRTTPEDEASWFRRCDAWWRGWDREDLRRSRTRESISVAELNLS
jgi:hypothetical protein